MQVDVVFRNRENHKLVGTLHTPDKEKYPILIICHGFGAHKDQHLFIELAEQLKEKGVATLRFDCRACGESEGTYHPSYKDMLDDMVAALSYVKKNDKIGEIYLAGHSMGGTTALILAATNKDVKKVISLGAVAHPGTARQKMEFMKKEKDGWSTKIGSQIMYFSETFFDDADDVHPLAILPQSHAAALIIHGTEDEQVPIRDAEELFMASSMPKRLKKISDTGHGFEGKHEELIKTIIEFLVEKEKKFI